MTTSVQKTLNKICNNDIFDNELYFSGGTALAYYLKHRISEDIDIISPKTLDYKQLIPNITALGAIKIKDENITALRIAGLFPDEYMIKFILDDVKLEFFQANRTIQKEILANAKFSNYQNSKLKILELKFVAKLKIVALILRNKSRDLFDFGAILNQDILSIDEILDIFHKVDEKIISKDNIINFIKTKKEPKDDEFVYLNESDRIDLTFDEIKDQVIEFFKYKN